MEGMEGIEANHSGFFVPMGEWELQDLQPQSSDLTPEQVRTLTVVADFQIAHNASFREMLPFSRRARQLSAETMQRMLACYAEGKPLEAEDEAAWETSGLM